MKKLISLILVLTLILTACGTTEPSGTDDSIQKEDSTGEDITEGGKYAEKQVYKTVYAEEITTINYLTTTTYVELQLAANLVDTLVDYDKYGVVQPDLAETWEVSDDGLTWTFHLRKKVKWVDFEGNEVAETTANDFVSAAQYILKPENESATANMFYSVIKNAEEYFNGEITDFSEVGVKAIDEYTLEYKLKEPVPYFESMLTYVCFFPAYGPFLEEMGDQFGTANSALLYNGAYLLSEFEPQMHRILKKNPTYWDSENVYITELNYKYNKEATALAGEMYKRGEVSDVIIPPASLDEWMNDSELKEHVRPDRLGTYTYFYAFNFDPKFDAEYDPENWKIAVNNTNFRKSIMSAFNRVAAMTTQDPYNPEYRIINTITPPEFTSQNGVDFTSIGDLAVISDKDFYNEEEALSYKEKAVQELTENGVTFPVKILMPYNTNSTSWANEAQVVKQQLETLLGNDYLEITLLPHAPTGFLDGTRRAGNYSLMQVNWGPDYADPQTYTDPFARGGTYNFPEYTTDVDDEGNNIFETYEALLEEAKSEYIDLTRRYELFAEAEALLINNAFVIPFCVSGGDGYVASQVHPFESQFAPFGISRDRWKGQKLLVRPLNTEEFNAAYEQWKIERDEALKEAN
ncbi:peptide ABC transporter substrate-binding protein [Sedimentibacter sp. MB31-C6]|uniref:peptide ABC transporter substrate-binding protein n=1 Tax=Sedimentibacter sp. MB31-C6 TaxID=3109366 RepID=UPI002DDCAB19|nr:peptide ABC transporter substrate-binding protein [Sedimentibacter sp. MB36-C1]WSI05496.1 peptide ABC transporter substrate-binding protein [Sedimentibacter sp. MB36-C1]